MTRSRQITNAVAYRFGDDTNAGYEYLRNGALSKQRNPSGRTLSWTYDDAGRPTAVGDGATAYVSSVSYTDHGAVKAMRLNGQRTKEGWSYDPNRLQLTGIAVSNCPDNASACTGETSLWSASYTYSTTTAGNDTGPDNNGNPRTQTIAAPGLTAIQQSYGYDGFNRLQTFTEGQNASTTLSDTYCYDAHGNRAVVTRTGLSSMTPQVATCTAANVSAVFPGNRIAGSSYDQSGALALDGQSVFRYNAEDLLAQSWPRLGTPTVTSYEYDGDNRRVAMVTGTSRVTFVYDAGGSLAADYGGSAGTVGTTYVHVDALGSTRLVTDSGGAVARRTDYWPFGEQISGAQTSYRTAALKYGDGEPRLKFTGKERDAETGLDYFGARYMSSAQGRFTSPDPLLSSGRPDNPQSWNRYAYVLNSPLRLIDPNGLADKPASPGFEDELKKKDKGLYDVIVASPNYSQAQFESEIGSGKFSDNTLFGLGGEAVVLDSYRQTTAAQPQIGLGAAGLGDDQRRVPDIGFAAPSNQNITTVLHGVATSPTSIGDVRVKAPNLFGFTEVKTGQLNGGLLNNAVFQIATSPVAATFRAVDVQVVAVDRGEWNRLSVATRTNVLGYSGLAGVRIQTFQGLNTGAERRVSNAVNYLRPFVGR